MVNGALVTGEAGFIGDIRKSCDVINSAKTLLGYEVKTSLIEGLTVLLRKLGFESREKQGD